MHLSLTGFQSSYVLPLVRPQTNKSLFGLARQSQYQSILSSHSINPLSATKPKICANHSRDIRAHAQSEQVCRPLSGLEQFYYEVTAGSENDTVSSYRVQLEGELPAHDIIQATLIELQKDIPALGQVIKLVDIIDVKKNNLTAPVQKLCFMPPDEPNPIPLNVMVSSDPHAWQQQISRAMKQTFDTERDSLIRFSIIRNPILKTTDVFFVGHHSLIDGQGSMHIMNRFFALLDQVKYNETPIDSSFIQATSAVQSTIALIDRLTSTCDNKYQADLSKINSTSISETPEYLATSKLTQLNMRYLAKTACVDLFLKNIIPIFQPNTAKNTTKIIHTTLDAQISKQILNQCKARNVSVFAALSAAAIVSSKKYFPQKANLPFGNRFSPFGHVVTTFAPVSIRNRIENKVPPEEMGCYTSLIRDVYTQVPDMELPNTCKGQQVFWQTVEAFQNSTHKQLDANEPEMMPWLLSQLFNAGGTVKTLQAAIVPDTLILNNMGRQEIKGPDQQLVKTYSWATQFDKLTPGASVNFSTINGHLNLSIFSRRLSQAEVDGLSRDILRFLQEATQPLKII